MEGWIKLHRKIQDTQLYPKNRPFTRFEAWLDLLILVNYKDNEIVLGNEIIKCKRGESARSVESYQKRWSWSRQAVRSFLNLLVDVSMIELKTTNKTTILTVCNYDSYQDEQPTDNQRITNEQPTDNQRITTNKESKEYKEVKKKKEQIKKFASPTLLEVENYCLERKNSVDPETWHAFYQAKGWMVGRNPMKDWRAAVRTWEKESSTGQKRNNTHSHIKVNHDSSY